MTYHYFVKTKYIYLYKWGCMCSFGFNKGYRGLRRGHWWERVVSVQLGVNWFTFSLYFLILLFFIILNSSSTRSDA